MENKKKKKKKRSANKCVAFFHLVCAGEGGKGVG